MRVSMTWVVKQTLTNILRPTEVSQRCTRHGSMEIDGGYTQGYYVTLEMTMIKDI